MFNYFLSVTVAFVVFGFIFNILKKVYRDTLFYNFDNDELFYFWILIVIISGLWFISVPILCVCLILYLLKLLTDKIADCTLNFINKRKLKKQSKQETKDGH